MLTIMVAAITLAAWIYPYQQQQAALRTLKSAEIIAATEVTAPDWITAVCGEKPFQEIVRVDARAARYREDWFRLLSRLPRLEHLELGGIDITAQHLEALAEIPRLKSLVLDSTAIRDSDLARWPRRKSVQITLRDERAITTVERRFNSLIQWTTARMTALRAGRVKVAPTPPAKNARRLQFKAERAYVADDALDDGEVALIAAMRNLRGLRMGGRITDACLPQLCDLHRLSRLQIFSSRIRGESFDSLRGLPINNLQISQSPLTPAGIRQLLKWPELTSLSIEETKLSPAHCEALGELQALRVLQLAELDLTAAHVQPLGRLQRLETLELSDNPLADGDLNGLANLQQLKTLRLSRTQLRDGSLAAVRRMTDLSTLDLDENLISGAGLIHLQTLTKLRTLRLSQTKVDDRGCALLARFNRDLRVLDLSGTRITDAGVQSLADLPQLISLYLHKTEITNRALSSLRKFPHLRQLYLHDTHITEGAVDALRNEKTKLFVIH